MISAILRYLDTPDNQGRDWYAWASNQLSHAFIGGFIVIVFVACGWHGGVMASLATVIAKKITDFIRVPVLNTLKDAWHDAAFWLAGALLVANAQDSAMVAYVSIVGTVLLLSGVVERAMRANDPAGT